MPDLPLNALRAFEVAARTGSFVQAGAQLGVSSAAVSQQVRQLEAHYGKRLFLRQGNRITLTDAGRAIYPRLEAALAELSAISADLREDRARARLIISCLPTLAESWLLPRLAGFDTGAGIELRVDEDPVVLARSGVDLRLAFGNHFYPDHQTQLLFRDRIIAVAAPDLAARGLQTLPDEHFIHTDWGPTFLTTPSWAGYWQTNRGRTTPDRALGLTVNQSHLAILAARHGLGAALVPERIAGDLIRTGQLVVCGTDTLAMAHDYVLVWPRALARSRPLQRLIAHLLMQ